MVTWLPGGTMAIFNRVSTGTIAGSAVGAGVGVAVALGGAVGAAVAVGVGAAVALGAAVGARVAAAPLGCSRGGGSRPGGSRRRCCGSRYWPGRGGGCSGWGFSFVAATAGLPRRGSR